MEQFTLEEQRQVFTACWNERARLESRLSKSASNGTTKQYRNATHERIDLLDTIIEKLKP